ncbi:hypothetical protein AgCh_000890 [Apium graveolens]
MFTDAQNTKGTDVEQKSVESQENSDVSKAINLPASLKRVQYGRFTDTTGERDVDVPLEVVHLIDEYWSNVDVVRKIATSFELPNKDRKDSQGICFLGTEVLEVNYEAPIHVSTILEDVEIIADGVEASEAIGSISHSILHTEAEDKIQKLVQDPAAIEESNDGKETHVSNIMLDLENDLFFPEDMPIHEIQKQISPIVTRQTTIEASQARLEANQAQMSDQLTEVLMMKILVKVIRQHNERRRVEKLTVTTKMQQSSQVTTVADEDQGILKKEVGAEADQYQYLPTLEENLIETEIIQVSLRRKISGSILS